jgi:ubiquitin C-terminal hydrolase
MHHPSLEVIKAVMAGGANNTLQRLVIPGPFFNPAKNPLVSYNESSRTSNAIVIGLRNIGNSCFLNSVVQALASLKYLHVYLHSNAREMDGIIGALYRTIRELTEIRHEEAGIPFIARHAIIQRRFLTGEQQDAHEFLRYLLAMVEEEIDKKLRIDHQRRKAQLTSLTIDDVTLDLNIGLDVSAPLWLTRTELHSSSSSSLSSTASATIADKLNAASSSSPLSLLVLSNEASSQVRWQSLSIQPAFRKLQTLTTILGRTTNPFCGILESCLQCIRCQYKSQTYQHFVDLSLTMRPSHKRQPTLTDCLDLFVRDERLTDIECPQCHGTGVTDEAQRARKRTHHTLRKRMSIQRPPQVLCLHVQRLVNGTFGLFKNTRSLQFDMELDLYPYSSNFFHTQVQSSTPSVPSPSPSTPPQPPPSVVPPSIRTLRTLITTDTVLRSLCNRQLKHSEDSLVAEMVSSSAGPRHYVGPTKEHRSTSTASSSVSPMSSLLQPANGSVTQSSATSVPPAPHIMNTTTADSASTLSSSASSSVSALSTSSTSSTLSSSHLNASCAPASTTTTTTTTTTLATTTSSSSAPHILYRLVAVIAHTGSAFGGHYTVYRRLPSTTPVHHYDTFIRSLLHHGNEFFESNVSSPQWVYISDEHCHFVDENKVLEAEAYMLFYEKVP